MGPEENSVNLAETNPTKGAGRGPPSTWPNEPNEGAGRGLRQLGRTNPPKEPEEDRRQLAETNPPKEPEEDAVNWPNEPTEGTGRGPPSTWPKRTQRRRAGRGLRQLGRTNPTKEPEEDSVILAERTQRRNRERTPSSWPNEPSKRIPALPARLGQIEVPGTTAGTSKVWQQQGLPAFLSRCPAVPRPPGPREKRSSQIRRTPAGPRPQPGCRLSLRGFS